MGRGGHGGAFTGGAHSHDPGNPEDTWNLYQHIEHATALNATDPDAAQGIFKPHVRRCEATPAITSDGDQEILVKVKFATPVHVRRVMVIGGGDAADGGSHPRHVKVYVNREGIDFSELDEVAPAQVFSLPLNEAGEAFIATTPPHVFTNVTAIAFFFDENHSEGEEDTVVRYIGMQGDHTHGRAEAVHAEYELLCQHGNETVPKPDLFNPRDLQG